MSLSLTRAQSELLAFIETYLDENNGVAPSFEEMREALGLASKSGVHRMVTALEERGLIARLPNKARCMEIVREPEPGALSSFSSAALVYELARRSAENRLEAA